MTVFRQQSQINSEAFSRVQVQTDQRRSANYKPNIWTHDFIQTLSTSFHEEEYKREADRLKEKVQNLFRETADSSAKLELVDCIKKLGLSSYFGDEIKTALDTIASFDLNTHPDLYITALCFKLLRLDGYQVSQDVFNDFIGEKSVYDIGGIMELLEASHLAQEGESVLEDAKILSTGILKGINSTAKTHLSKRIAHSLEIPSYWRAQWFNVKWQIDKYEEDKNIDKCVVDLAKVNFNIVQSTLQNDLKDISRWWRESGLIENLNFSRDRLVESFLCSVGLGFEPKQSSFRKWLTKVVLMILVIDDVYDIYGSLEELHIFTDAVHRWEITAEVQNLPKCMQLCFESLYNMTNDIAHEIHFEKRLDLGQTQAHLKKVEAKWYNKGYTPTLEEYLKNGWVSSSGCLLAVHSFFFIIDEVTQERLDFLGRNQDLLLNISLIIRLCNDLGTSSEEQERGDTASSIICYMRQKRVSEEAAINHIKDLINNSWKKINGKCFTNSSNDDQMKLFVNISTNMARVAHNLYQNGDGFGAQGLENKKQISSLLVYPLNLD